MINKRIETSILTLNLPYGLHINHTIINFKISSLSIQSLNRLDNYKVIMCSFSNSILIHRFPKIRHLNTIHCLDYIKNIYFKSLKEKNTCDLKSTIETIYAFLETQSPKGTIEKWKFIGVNRNFILHHLIQIFFRINPNYFEDISRCDEFLIKYVKNIEIKGFNFRIKPKIPNELKKPIKLVIKLLKNYEPERINRKIFWKGISLSILLGHVQKYSKFKFQKWYHKWKKFILQIPDIEFNDKGLVCLHVENRKGIFEREVTKHEILKIKNKSSDPYLEKLEIQYYLLKNDQKKKTISLFDRLIQVRIIFPGRGINCMHIQPFDLEHYLKLGLFDEKEGFKKKWKCSICNEMAYKNDLFYDKFWLRVFFNSKIVLENPNLLNILSNGSIEFGYPYLISFDPISRKDYEHLKMEVKK